MALDDTKYTSLRSAHDDIHPSPTSTSNPSPTLPEDTPIPRNEATNDHHPPDKATILTGELLQIGAMAVVGVVGFLLVFAVGAMVGDDRRTLDSGWEPRRGNGRRRGAYERRTLSGW